MNKKYSRVNLTLLFLIFNVIISSTSTIVSSSSFSSDSIDKITFTEPLHEIKNADTVTELRAISTSQKNAPAPNCSILTTCIKLDKCPELFKLLENPSPRNINLLKEASCGFDIVKEPLVYCEKIFCTQVSPGNFKTSQTESLIKINQKNSKIPLISQSSQKGNSTKITKSSRLSLNKINYNGCGFSSPDRIFGGADASREEFPWIAAISAYTSSGPKVICGGALISDEIVLTAAHCVISPTGFLRNISHVRLGAFNINDKKEEDALNYQVSKILFHEDFRDQPSIKNDIALIKLSKRVDFGLTIRPVCLPTGSYSVKMSNLYGKYGTIVGWGSDGSKTSYEILQKANVPIVHPETCKAQFRRVRVRIFQETQLCAGENGRDSCKGDSGGPLTINVKNRHVLLGVISFGTVQCDGRLPGVYSNVTSYLEWILQTIDDAYSE